MITIIAPVYNTGEYLRQCMDSVINQTVTEWELIMVDDGSTDDSLDIIKEYVNKDARISFYASNAGCVSVARNTGIEHAKGNWILFLDSDDYILPDCLEILLKASNEHPEADIIQASFIVDNQATGKKCITARGDSRRKFEGKVCDGNTFLSDHGWLVGVAWNTLIRAAYLHQHHILFPSDISFQEDMVFIIELARYGGKFVYVDIPTFVYRWGRKDSLTSKAEGHATQRKKKVEEIERSILKASVYYKSVRNCFTGSAKKLLDTYIYKNATGILGGITNLDKRVQNLIVQSMSQNLRKIPVLEINRRGILALIYNLSPKIAFKIRNLL